MSIERVQAALRALRRIDAQPVGQGLSALNAERCLVDSVDDIVAGLTEDVIEGWSAPRRVALVLSHGVFTSPLEWVALYAAAGSAVHLKAPSRDPAFCQEIARLFCQSGLDVTVDTKRSLPTSDAVLVFGGDQTVEAVRNGLAPRVAFRGYGHRFSVAVVDDAAQAGALADDHARYDTAGCFAPAAVVFVGDDPRPLFEGLCGAMADAERRWPRGTVDPALGPEWRRRVGLARVMGQVRKGEHHAVIQLPIEHFVPVALPRMVTLYHAGDASFLAPWRPHLSSLATVLDAPQRAWFHRVCPPGELQRPRFPRLHDGLDMRLGR